MPDALAPVLRVLIVGASGVFGSRLAERLALESGIALSLAGRRRAPLEAVRARIGGGAIRLMDRDTITGRDLAGYDLVIDAAGPFQQSGNQLVAACLDAGIDYVDLADGRDWVVGFADRFDERARGAGVALVTGASSIPALSHAAMDALVVGWSRIDTVSVGIFPGNRTPRGLSVVEAILSYAGRPVRHFSDGRWQVSPGWGRLRRGRLPIGTRWASLCDTPEQDLLVARYAPTRAARFEAGLELSVLHLGLWLASLPVRYRLIRSLRPLARTMHRIASWLEPFGTARGGMLVEVEGEGPDGPRAAGWWLDADDGMGPYVPTLAALALVRRRRDIGALPVGARPCSGMLDLTDFEADFDALGLDASRVRVNQPERTDSVAFSHDAAESA